MKGIFIVDMSTMSTQFFSGAPEGAYNPHALALADDDSVLVTGCASSPYSVSVYDTESRTRLWIQNTSLIVSAVGILGAHVLVTVYQNPTLVLDCNTGACIASRHKADGHILGLGVIEGLFLFSEFLTPSDLHTIVYLAMLQHLLYKQDKPLRLPLEMWDWVAKYHV